MHCRVVKQAHLLQLCFLLMSQHTDPAPVAAVSRVDGHRNEQDHRGLQPHSVQWRRHQLEDCEAITFAVKIAATATAAARRALLQLLSLHARSHRSHYARYFSDLCSACSSCEANTLLRRSAAAMDGPLLLDDPSGRDAIDKAPPRWLQARREPGRHRVGAAARFMATNMAN